MRILLDSHSTVTQNDSGGLQVRIFEHLHALGKKNVDVKLFNKWEDKIENFDIYHLFKVTKDSYNEVLFAKQKGKKIVVSAVVPLSGGRNISISLLLASLCHLSLPYEFIRKVLNLADIVTTQTEDEKLFLIKYFKIKSFKIIVIPNGVSHRFVEQKKLEVSFSAIYNLHKPYVLQVGRFDKNKNQLNVIKALRKTDIPVVFIGGPFVNEMKYYEQCKNELTDNMLMTGWLDHKSDLILSAFREAKVLVLPSCHETFGNVLIEGGVSGTNLTCSESLPINKHELSRYWTTFNPIDEISIRNAILYEYEKISDNSMQDAFISAFSWDKVIDQYLCVYRKLLNK
ncbi:glycosyltransferase [Myroides odoratus]|uniref:glycosyltransferase n=1 Tax=Myroides odoratus TaxID=256 RepID=UPI00333FAE28